MSGQWEVVGKSKKEKQSGKTKKMSKNEKKKFVDNAPKVEDLLPLAQVKTLYSALDTNKEPVKPVEKAVKTKENEAKKAQKKPKEKKETIKENKPPKTIEAAVALITTADVENVLEVGRMRFSEAPLVWLKGLASWLNTKLPVDHTDNTFTAKSWEYPLCLLSSDTRAVLKKALRDVPDSAVQMFFDYCLTSMANDMTKGSPVTGYKMLLQLVASQLAGVAVNNMAKCATLRHSYQNRPAIGCSIMWALGQTGFKDLSTGLQVWQSVMFPVYELRHYTQFVSDYLRHLLARHSTSKALSHHLYLDILDTVCSRQTSSQQLNTHLHTLQGILCNVQPDNQLHQLFEPLLSRLSPNSSPALKDQVLRLLTQCLAEDCQVYTVWRDQYTRHLPHSALLLRHLNGEWSSVRERLPAKQLKDTLRTFRATSQDMTKHKQKAEGLQECSRLCDALLGKMAEGRRFPWARLVVLTLMAVAGAVAFSVANKNGSFADSRIGEVLRDLGVLSFGEQAWVRVQEAYRWTEAHMPVYAGTVWEVSAPYLRLVTDWVTTLVLQVAAGLSQVTQYCLDKKPVIEQWVGQYAPGLVEAVSLWLGHVWQWGLHTMALVLKYLSFTVDWLQGNVFVGRLSPENLQKVTLEAINTTQTLAAQTFSWLNSKASNMV